MKIRLKIAILVAGTLVVLLPLLSYVYYQNVRKVFLDEIYGHLESLSETKAIRLNDLAEKRFELLKLISTQPHFRRALENSPAPLIPELKPIIEGSLKRYGAALKSINDINICQPDGKVYVSNNPSNIGRDYSNRLCFKKAMGGEIFWGDFHSNKNGKLNTYISGPMFDTNGVLNGILILETNASEILSLTADYTGLGKTGETVIGVRERGISLLTKLRLDSSGVVERKINPKDKKIPMVMALGGKTGIMKEGKDYRGTEVIASLRYIKRLDWGMVTKIDVSEAYQPIRKLLRFLILINIFGVSITFAIAFIVSGIISMPVESLTKTVEIMKAGDLSIRANINSKDEIGTLASSFNDLAQNLERKIADIENFTYTASHDLKAPIANLEGLLNALMKQLEGKIGEREALLLNMFSVSIEKFKNTIKDLGEITKAHSTRPENIEYVDLEEIYNEVKLNIQNMILESHADLRTNFSVKFIRFSRKDLNSMFHNLITNAIKYRSSDRLPIIHVSTEKLNNKILLSVKDNGLGFDIQHKEKLFMMFKRLHTHVEGSGIGLYLLKRIVDLNGGTIEVESKPGEGTTFYILLNG